MITYYVSTSGENPVKEFLESLQIRQKAKIFRILEDIEIYGLDAVASHLKKLIGTPFWEIRVLGQDNIRIIYLVSQANTLLLLHGFMKKTQQTPFRDITTAYHRYKLWIDK